MEERVMQSCDAHPPWGTGGFLHFPALKQIQTSQAGRSQQLNVVMIRKLKPAIAFVLKSVGFAVGYFFI